MCDELWTLPLPVTPWYPHHPMKPITCTDCSKTILAGVPVARRRDDPRQRRPRTICAVCCKRRGLKLEGAITKRIWSEPGTSSVKFQSIRDHVAVAVVLDHRFDPTEDGTCRWCNREDDLRTTPCRSCGRSVIHYRHDDPICSHRCQRRIWRGTESQEVVCETCGEAFTPPRSDARFCSNRCRQRAYRARRAPEAKALS